MKTDERLLRKQNVSMVLFSLALIGCITILLYIAYSSQQRIQTFALDQLRQDAEKRAGAVSYFYLERRNDLNSLAEQRALSTFFENQALGMSMQYGLRDSLFAISEQFEKLLDEKKLGAQRIFTRVLFLNTDGSILTESRAKGSGEADARPLSPPALGEGTYPDIRLIGERNETGVIATIPYYFKGKYVGRIIAFIASDVVYDYLLQPQTSPSKRALAVTGEKGQLLYSALGPAQNVLHVIENHSPEMISGLTYHYGIPGENGANKEIISLRTPIHDTPFYLVSIAPSEEILSGLTPAKLLFFMAAVCLLILCAMLLVTRINSRKFLLQARLSEAARSQKALEEKNELLQKEIAERLRAEESLRNSQELFSTFMSHLPAAVYMRDPEGRFLFANRYCMEVFGWEDVIGKTAAELFPPEQAERMDSDDKMALRQGKHVINETISNALGGERVFETRKFTVLAGRDTTLLGAVLLDITERRKAEADKQRLELQLRQSQKLEAIGTLAGGIAHDFNNILSPIIGFTEMALADIPRTSQMSDNLEEVLKAANRARDLVKQILFVSRYVPEQQRAAVDLSSVVSEALKFLRALLPTTIEIRRNLEKGVVLADVTQIHRVLMNLCTNAAHAMNDRGILDVQLSRVDLGKSDLADRSIVDLRPGSYLELCISDTGSGMDTATMERIFDPYFTTKEVGKGSGLGLAVVRGIVKKHDGAISVRSEQGKGTTFRVYLPLMEASVDRTADTVKALPTGNERVLLVDDERVVAEMGKAVLDRLGYRVTTETDSLRALDIFRSRPDEFDLIITDYTMPHLTGIDLSREMHLIRPDIPIILCTGYSQEVTLESAAKLGVELVMKPFAMKEIAVLIREVFRKKRP
ncbi:MAG: ATP-binding protein [Syntrophobacter sp.]